MTNRNGTEWCCGKCYHYNEVEPWEVDETIQEGWDIVISECDNCGNTIDFDIPDDWQQPEPEEYKNDD